MPEWLRRTLVRVDVLVLVADLGLGRWREERRDELSRLLHAFWQDNVMHSARLLILDPSRTCEQRRGQPERPSSRRSKPLTGDVTSDDRLHRQHLRPAHPDSSALELIGVLLHLLGHFADLGGDDMIRNVLRLGSRGKEVEEEQGQSGEELALVRDALQRFAFKESSLRSERAFLCT